MEFVKRIFAWVDSVIGKTFDIAIHKVLDVLGSLIEGLRVQLSTAKGAVWFILGLFVVADILLGGKTGVIGFMITQIKDILQILVDMLKAAGWQMVIVVLLVYMIVKK